MRFGFSKRRRGRASNGRPEASHPAMIASSFLLAIAVLGMIPAAQGTINEDDPEGPSFLVEPPMQMDFSNTTGAILDCSAKGKPSPTVSWVQVDGTPAGNVTALRQALPGGKLVFLPFRAEDYRQDIHAVHYRCMATNSVGTIASRQVQVRAVLLQTYDVHVYDTYVIFGNTAILKCHIPTVLSDYVRVTSWTRDEAYSIPVGQIKDSDEKYIVMPNGDLHIRHARLSDGASRFRCHTIHRLTGQRRSSVTAGRMFVTDPKGSVPPKVTDSLTSVRVKLGDTLIVPCVAQGNPAPEFKWFLKQGRDIQHQVHIGVRAQQTPSSLIIPNAQLSDGGTYSCEATNSVGSERAETIVVVTARLSAKIDPPLLIAEEKKPAVIKCLVAGYPVTSVVWMKNGRSLLTVTQNLGPTVELRVETVDLESRGMYQCMVRNNYDSAQASGELRLKDASPVVRKGFEEKVLQPGPGLSLQCVVAGSPPPLVTWTLDDIPITGSGDRVVVNSFLDATGDVFSTLNISTTRVEDGGLYRCLAINKAGKVEHLARVNIYGRPSVRVTPKLPVVAGSDVWIHCPMYGYPIDIIQWEKGGRTVPFDLRQSVFRNGTMMITNVQRNVDGGKYVCSVKNKHGQSAKEEKELVIMVPPKIMPFSFQDELLREGMRARLQCVVGEGDLPLQIQWTKDNRTIPKELGVHIRDLDEYSSILTIVSITPRHNGNYSCRATNPAAQVMHTSELFVNVPPKIIPFAFVDDQFYMGMRAHITCAVSQGDFPISFQWFKDGQTIPAALGVITKNYDEHANSLSIEGVSSKHSGNYTCLVSNGAGSASYSAQLLVHVPPKIVPFSFQHDQLFEGMLARVSCVVSRGDLPLDISWEKDGRVIPSLGVTVRTFDEYSSILSIDSVNARHNGNYTCIARNDAGKATLSAILVVNVPPRWTVQPADASVVLGGQLLLNCSADGFPEPTITWMRVEGAGESVRKEVIHTSIDFQLYSNGSLLIRRAQTDHKGLYFCQASNGIGGGLSTPVNIHVHSPPRFEVKFRNHTVRRGESFQVPCEAKGDGPITIAWMKNGQNRIGQQADSRYAVKEGSAAEAPLSELYVMAADRSDTATFTCVAENAYGKDEANINIIVQEPPDSPNNLTVGGIDSRAVVLSWLPPFDGNSRIIKYVVQYKNTAGSWQDKVYEISVNGKENIAHINGLNPATDYQFRVLAENAIGISAGGKVINVTMAEEAPQSPPENVKVEAINPQTLKVNWKPPKKDQWNGSIRGYNVGHRVVGTSDSSVFKSYDMAELFPEDMFVLITDLNKFTQYGVVVQAFNERGKGPLSDEMIAMTSEDVPSKPPREVRCTTLTSQTVHVTWQPPLPDGLNGILRGYKLFYKPIKEWYDEAVMQKKTPQLKMTLQDLEKFTNYSLQVLAFTKMGDGVLSDPIFCRTLDDGKAAKVVDLCCDLSQRYHYLYYYVPSPPADIKAIPTSLDSIVISWRPPSKPNGVVKQYTLYRKIPTQKKEDAVKYVVPASSQSYEVTGLKKTQRYEFWVTASTSAGEGQSSTVVIQTPTGPIVPSRVLSFNEQILTAWKSSLKLSCKMIGSPTPERKWVISGDHIRQNDRIKILRDGSLQFENIQSEDSGNYTCAVQNGFGDDSVVYAVVVLVPPSAPVLEVVSTTTNSIELSWKLMDDGGIKIQGYTLNMKREFGQWEQINIPPEASTYSLNDLECGTRYHLYLFAFNKVGMGTPSEVVIAATEGTIPDIPTKEAVVEEGITSVTLRLHAWKSEKCPILYYVLEYKSKSSNEWNFVSNNIKPEQRKLVVPGLSPATWYDLRMTAHNNAGSNVATYEFGTRTVDGGVIQPTTAEEDIIEIPFFEDLRIILPISICLVGVVILLIVMCICFRRTKGDNRSRVKAVLTCSAHKSYNSKKSHKSHSHKCKQNTAKKVSRNGDFKSTNPRTPAPDYDPPPIPGTEDGYNMGRIQMLHPVHGPTTGCGSPSFLRGLRTVHPVAVPTAPPMSETSSLAYEPQDPRFPRHGGATRGQQIARRPGNNVYPAPGFGGHNIVTEETTFIFPTNFQDSMNYSEVVDAERDHRRVTAFDNRHSRVNEAGEATGLLPQRRTCF